MTLPFDHTHDLDLGVSRSESEIALSQEWGSLLTMNEKDASYPFMTMILTCVTMVGWADVPDSDRGDFRRRRAVNISSFITSLDKGTNYNMTVWILAGNYISFTIAAGLIRLHMPGVKKSRV